MESFLHLSRSASWRAGPYPGAKRNPLKMSCRKTPPGGRPGDCQRHLPPPPPPTPVPLAQCLEWGRKGNSQDRTSVHARLAMPNKYEIPSSATVGCVPTRSPFEPVNLDSIFLQGLGAFSTGCTFSSVSRHLK